MKQFNTLSVVIVMACEGDAASVAETTDGIEGTHTASTALATSLADLSSGGSEVATDPEIRCGDAVVSAGEICDDGNSVNGDGCNVDCIPSGERLWEYRSDLPLDDDFRGVVVTKALEIFVGGSQGVDGGQDRWLARFSEDGQLVWSRVYVAERSTYLLGLGGTDAQVYGVGATEGDEFRTIRVSSFDLDGDIRWEDEVTSTFGAAYATGAGSTPDGGVVVAGLTTIDDSQAALWVRRYDPDGAPKWTEERPIGDSALFSQGPGVAVGSSQVAAGFYSEPGFMSLLVAYPLAGGKPIFNTPVAEQVGPIYAVAVAADGDILTTGWWQGLGTSVGRFSGAGDPVWSTLDCTGNAGRGIAVDSQGDVVVVGDTLGDTMLDIRLCKFAADGTLRWGRVIDGGVGRDRGSSVAILPDGRILAAGEMRGEGGRGADAWVAMFSP